MSTPHANPILAGLRWLLGLGMMVLALFVFWRFGLPAIQQWLVVHESVMDELRLLPVVDVHAAKQANQQPFQHRFATLISENNGALESYSTVVKPVPIKLVSGGDSAKSLRLIAVTLTSSGNLTDLVHINQAIAKAFPLATVELAQFQLSHPDSLNPEESTLMTLNLKLNILAKTPALK